MRDNLFKNRRPLAGILAGLFSAVLTGALPVQAAESPSLIVNTTSDAVADDGVNSLREAVAYANSHTGPDTITFNIPTTDAGYANGVFTIRAASELNLRDTGTQILGSSQTEFTGNSNLSGPEIEIKGSDNAIADTLNGIVIRSNNCVIQGLGVNSFGANIIIFSTNNNIDNNLIEGCYVGISPNGAMAQGARPSNVGIFIWGGAGNRIGGREAIQRNIIAGNRNNIYLEKLPSQPTSTTVVVGNFIGLDFFRSLVPVGEGATGITISSSGNTIGGGAAGEGNTIMQEGPGIQIRNSGAPYYTGNVIRGNNIISSEGVPLYYGSFGSEYVLQPNDTGDGDVGPNNFQNIPAITSAELINGRILVTGTLNSTPNSSFAIDLYFMARKSTPTVIMDRQSFGTKVISTDSNGDATFAFDELNYNNLDIDGGQIAATATSVTTLDTSPYSPLFKVGLPTLSVNDVVNAEGGTTTPFTVSLSHPYNRPVTVTYFSLEARNSFSPTERAISTRDYQVVPGRLTFAPGETTKTIPVYIANDVSDENGEVFFLDLYEPTNATLGRSRGICKIIDNDEPPTLTVDNGIANNGLIVEGDDGTKKVTLTVRLSAETGKGLTVKYRDVAGTAKPGEDYEPFSGQLSFLPPLESTAFGENYTLGETFKTFEVTIKGDIGYEPNETFSIELYDRTDTLALLQNPPVYNPANQHHYAVTRGAGDWSSMQLFGSLSSVNGVTGHLATITSEEERTFIASQFSSGNYFLGAHRASSNDGAYKNWTWITGEEWSYNYPGNTGTPTDELLLKLGITSPPGTATWSSALPIVNDDTTNPISSMGDVYRINAQYDVLVEYDTTGPVPTPEPILATVTIENDDLLPTVSTANVTLDEGNSGTKMAAFTVKLSAAFDRTVTVDYATANETALAGEDYVAKSGSLSFAPGETEKTINVETWTDIYDEADETFALRFSNVTNATLLTPEATCTLIDDDAIEVSIDDLSVIEGNSGSKIVTLTARLAQPSTRDVSIDAVSVAGTATPNVDFSFPQDRYFFNAWTTSRTISFTVYGDTDSENDEYFDINYKVTQEPNQPTQTKRIYILNDDIVPIVTVANITTPEGPNGSFRDAEFVVKLAEPSTSLIMFDYKVIDITATKGVDYTLADGIVSFSPGVTTQTIRANIIGDNVSERSETFKIALTPAGIAGAPVAEAICRILNDDNPTDTTNPTGLTITAPTDGAMMRSFPVFKGTATDNVGGSGIDYIEYSLGRVSDQKYWNGTSWITRSFMLPTDQTNNGTGVNWQSTVASPTGADLPNNRYTLYVRAYDRNGNSLDLSANYIIKKDLDMEAPVVAITTPAHQSNLARFSIVSGTVSDTGGSGPRSVELTIRRGSDGLFWTGTAWGARTPLSTQLQAGTGGALTWNRATQLPTPASLSNGTYTLVASAYDYAGNTSDATSVVRFDLQAPTVALTNPLHNTNIPAFTTITGTASDSGGSNLNRVEVVIRRDSDGLFWTGTVWGARTPLSTQLQATSGGAFTWNRSTQLPPKASLTSGNYTVSASAFDGAGNVGSATIVFRIDVTAPTISILSPTHGSALARFGIINGETSDTGGSGLSRVEVVIRRGSDGLFWTGSTWGASTPLVAQLQLKAGGLVAWNRSTQLPTPASLTSGNYYISASAYDGGGNMSNTTVQVAIDTSAPTLAITSPTHGSRVTSLTAISGTVADSGGSNLNRVEVVIRRDSDGLFWTGSAWGVRTPLAATLGYTGGGTTWQRSVQLPNGSNLPNGIYTIAASAFDRAGNQTNATASFNYQGAAPVSPKTSEPQAPASKVVLSLASATAHNNSVSLIFTGPLATQSATAPERYTVAVNDEPCGVTSVQQINTTTVLVTPDADLQTGDVVSLSYNLLDSKKQVIRGQTRVTVR
jgi:hypothetical protein